MKATQKLHDLGQCLWLDNITRGLLTSGTLRRYINEFSVTGLTSNPTIFDKAIKESGFYDDAIPQKAAAGKSGEALAASNGGSAPDTVNPMPEKTLLAYADHGKVRGELPAEGGDAEALLAEFARARVDDAALATQLQREGTGSFDKSWNDLMDCIASKSAMLKKNPQARGR
jgi:transaldolase